MKWYLGPALLLVLSGCWSRPCNVAATIPAPPCKAEGSDSDGWRIASSVCRKLEATGVEVERAHVSGTHLSLRFFPSFGQQLLADEVALEQTIEDFLSLLSDETGSDRVSIEVLSGDAPIANGQILESGERQITLLQKVPPGETIRKR